MMVGSPKMLKIEAPSGASFLFELAQMIQEIFLQMENMTL